MASRILRRSGNAVVEYLQNLDWRPDFVVMVGLGLHHEEIDVMREKWGDRRRIIAFEAHPEICKAVKANRDDVEVHNLAICNDAGEADLYTKRNWKDGSSLIPKTQKPEEYHTIKVQTQKLDEALADILPKEGYGLLWLDCEGSELDALQGATDVLNRFQVVNIEQTQRPRGDAWPTPHETHSYLRYRYFYQSWTHTHRTCIGQFDSIYVHHDIFDAKHCNCLDSIYAHEISDPAYQCVKNTLKATHEN